MNKIKLLLAEDEEALGAIVKESLETREFEVALCEDGKVAWQTYQSKTFDVLVLDVMMPGIDGFSLAEKIRKEDATTPIIFLTSRSQTADVVKGFGKGGNDYLKKPFSMEELIVRIKALHNRKSVVNAEKQLEYKIGNYVFSPEKQQLILEGKTQTLTYREALVLEVFAQKPNQLVEKSHILKDIWGNDDFFTGRSLDVFITKLRKKLKDDTSVQFINLRGYGYKLVV